MMLSLSKSQGRPWQNLISKSQFFCKKHRPHCLKKFFLETSFMFVQVIDIKCTVLNKKYDEMKNN